MAKLVSLSYLAIKDVAIGIAGDSPVYGLVKQLVVGKEGEDIHSLAIVKIHIAATQEEAEVWCHMMGLNVLDIDDFTHKYDRYYIEHQPWTDPK